MNKKNKKGLSPLSHLQDQAEAKKKELETWLKRNSKEASTASVSVDPSKSKLVETKPQSPPSPLANARYGLAKIGLYDRGEQANPLFAQPWLRSLVNFALEASAKQELHLALVWPGQADPLSLVHALATFERFAIGDKRGLRALVYPTTRLLVSVLNDTLVDRNKLLEWALHYLTVSAGSALPLAGRDDQNKDMMLMALQSARLASPRSDYPILAEILPNFSWDRSTKSWGHYGDKFLRRSKLALRRSHKKDLFKQSEDGRMARLGHPETSPDALFGITHLANATERRAALKSKAFEGATRQPELVFFDLTRSMRLRTEKNLSRIVREAMDEIHEGWRTPFGILIVTDDPRTFFTIQKSFRDRATKNKIPLIAHTVLAGPQSRGLSSDPYPEDWIPPAASLRHYPIRVFDQEASEVAFRFWALSECLEEGSAPAMACREAASYMLRIANLPGGYEDYMAWMSSSGFMDSVRKDLSWIGHEFKLQTLLDQGALGANAEATRRAISRARKLIAAYAQGTPLALHIAKELSSYATRATATVTIAFRFNTDIPVARAFLERYQHFPNSQPFSNFANRIKLVNHRELNSLIQSDKVATSFIFVGLPDDTLKLLTTSEQVPADSIVLLDYRRANDLLIGLRALRTVDTYKPYRGRIAGLAEELERRLEELPKAVDVEKLGRMKAPRLSLSAAASEAARSAEVPGAWKLELEGDRRVYVGQKVYLYDPDQIRPFRQENIGKVKPDDLVFVMSDGLKDLFEACLAEAGHPVMRGASLGEMIRTYHQTLIQNAKRLFGDLRAQALARVIQGRMSEIAPTAKPCSLNRIRYWIDVEDSADRSAEDLKPHSTWSKDDFETFAKAIELPANLIDYYWMIVTGQRRALQEAGRELAERYAHVLFTEETAETLYRLKREAILRLQREAAQNTFRVVRIIPPVEASEPSNA